MAETSNLNGISPAKAEPWRPIKIKATTLSLLIIDAALNQMVVTTFTPLQELLGKLPVQVRKQLLLAIHFRLDVHRAFPDLGDRPHRLARPFHV